MKAVQGRITSVDLAVLLPSDEVWALLTAWRNDPETRRHSRDRSLKDIEQLKHDFSVKYRQLPELLPVFIVVAGERVGFIGFSAVALSAYPFLKIAEISISIAPDWRQRGIATAALQAAQQLVAAQNFDGIYAEIKESNHASQQLFAQVGFLPFPQVAIATARHSASAAAISSELSIDSYLWLKEKGSLAAMSDRLPRRVTIIAEAGSNWRLGSEKRDLKMAKTLIEVAKEAGCDAVKFQVYRARSLYAQGAGQSHYLSEHNIHEPIDELLSDLEMHYDLVPQLAAWCQEAELGFMATPFSLQDFSVVNPWVSAHKVASYELEHYPLLEAIAETRKPLFLSTGAATMEEIGRAVSYFRGCGGGPLTLMQCTAAYPASWEAMNLLAIPRLAFQFQTAVGLSDHSQGAIAAAAAAVALGATAIEKHFTASRRLPGPDHPFAVEPAELSQLVYAVREAERLRGDGIKRPMPEEEELRQFARRALHATQAIVKGETLHLGVNMELLRPGNRPAGAPPCELTAIEGRVAGRSLKEGEGILLADICAEEVVRR